jgi:hypothetical protein
MNEQGKVLCVSASGFFFSTGTLFTSNERKNICSISSGAGANFKEKPLNCRV